MTEFNPPRNWKWRGSLLWFTIDYDHRFEAVSPTRAKFIWTVDAQGFGVSVFGPLFAKIYARNLDQAIPRFVSEAEADADMRLKPPE